MFKRRRKLLSQNFIKDRELINRLICASGISWRDTVLEIGAGTGIITGSLLSASKKVIAIEIDKNLFRLLSERLGDNKALKLVCGDFLELELPKEPYKVFSNIPFSITGEIVKKLIFSDNPPGSCNLVVQKEAAEKLVVGRKKNSMLSILFYPWFEVKISHIFNRTDFAPNPGVDVCLLQIIKRPTPLICNDDLDKYRDFVTFKFTGHRMASKWPLTKWLSTYTKSTRCQGSFLKWQRDQGKLEKIHRTRTDKDWVRQRHKNLDAGL